MSWPNVKLREVGSFRNGLNYSSANLGSGLKVVNVADFKDRSSPDYDSLGEIDPQGVAGDSDLLQDGDILFVRSNGNRELVGRSMLIRNAPIPVSHSAFTIRLRFESRKVSPRFYSYYFRSPLFRKHLSLQGAGTNICNLNQRILGDLELPVPTISAQNAVTDILSAYDELMENNRRRIRLLENAIRLLYQEWFLRLRFPGHEHTSIAHGLPRGWDKKRLNTLTSFLKRGIAPHYDDEASGLVINQKCIRDGRLNMSLSRHQSREFATERQVQVGDVLVNSTGEGTLGRVAQVKVALENCTVDTHVTIVRPKPEISIHYFGMAVMAWEPRFSTMGRGATNQTELAPAAIGEAEIVIPHKTVLKEFEEFAEPISAQVSNLVLQNDKLRAARDLLLPRLMNEVIAV